VLDFKSKRATRVSKSSMGAEVLILVRASEALQKVASWIHEIWFGVDHARDFLDAPNPVPCQLITDANDVWLTMHCTKPYSGADDSLASYLECLREDLLQGKLDEFLWCATGDMLADGGTKDMPDVLATTLLRLGGWWPNEYKVLERRSIDGSDTVDRMRRLQAIGLRDPDPFGEDDDEESTPQDPSDPFAWYYGCTSWSIAGCGCNGECPVCLDTHYASDEDRTPLTFWTN
jgi:hypothetical protein